MRPADEPAPGAEPPTPPPQPPFETETIEEGDYGPEPANDD
jgi:hypothetical protein